MIEAAAMYCLIFYVFIQNILVKAIETDYWINTRKVVKCWRCHCLVSKLNVSLICFCRHFLKTVQAFYDKDLNKQSKYCTDRFKQICKTFNWKNCWIWSHSFVKVWWDKVVLMGVKCVQDKCHVDSCHPLTRFPAQYNKLWWVEPGTGLGWWVGGL